MKKSEQSQQTRDALLEAAEQQFARSGFDAASVAEICESAGVSKGAFYYHFNSKQTLFFQLLQRWLGNLEARLEEIESQSERVPEQLLSMANVVGEVLEIGGPQLSIYLEFWNQAIRDPVVHDALNQPFEDFLDFFSNMLQAGMQRGVIRNTDAEQAARVITALGIGLLFQGLLNPKSANWNEVTGFGLNLLLDGMRAEVIR